MIPNNVLDTISEQLRPLLVELARYAKPEETVRITFDIGGVLFDFKNSKQHEDSN